MKPKLAVKPEPIMVDLNTLNLGMSETGIIVLGVEKKKGEIDVTKAVDFSQKFNDLLGFIMKVQSVKSLKKIEEAKKKPKILGMDGRVLN